MRRAIFLFAILSATAMLAGCATPEARLRNGLVSAGASPPLARCMAARMVDRLSLGQLMTLSRLPRAAEASSAEQLLRRVRALGDAEIVGVTAGSAALCATGIAR